MAVAAGANLSATTGASVTDEGTLIVDPEGVFSTGGTLTLDTGGYLSGGAITAAAYQLDDGTASANLSGPGGLTKDTSGTVLLTGADSYAGPTVVKDGTLIATNASALPSGTSLVVAAGGTFVFDPSQAPPAAPATLTWTGTATGNWSDAHWSGSGLPYPNNTANAVVGTTGVVQVTSNQAANELAIQSGGEVAVAAGADLSIATGTSVTGGGTLNVDPKGAFSSGGTLILDSGGSLSGGPITAAAYQLNAGTANANLSGPGGLTKDTSGSVTLSGANSYAGPTVVMDGKLIVTNASALPKGTILTIQAGGTLVFDPSQTAANAAVAGSAMPASASETPAPAVISPATAAKLGTPVGAPVDFSTAAATTLHGQARAPFTHGRTDVLRTPAAMSSAKIDAVFRSHPSAPDLGTAPADDAQSGRPWAWLAALESPSSSWDQNQKSDSGFTALDMILARFGL